MNLLNCTHNDELLLGLLLNIRQRKYILSKSDDEIKNFVIGLKMCKDVDEYFDLFYLKNEMKAWV